MIFSSDKFYTLFADNYEDYAMGMNKYISSVNKFIKDETKSVKSIVDVGAGNGKRGRRIADLLNIKEVTLVDNSDRMVKLAKEISSVEVVNKDISALDFKLDKQYDLVLFLWNVMGHVRQEGRIIAVNNLANLLHDKGSMFVDVNNRYNVSQYGFLAVVKNLFRDLFLQRVENGNFILKVKTRGGEIETVVHIFNPFEIEKLFRLANLKVEKRKVINYKNGNECRTIFGGQLVYKISKK